LNRGPLATHEVFDPADEVLKARIIIFYDRLSADETRTFGQN